MPAWRELEEVVVAHDFGVAGDVGVWNSDVGDVQV